VRQHGAAVQPVKLSHGGLVTRGDPAQERGLAQIRAECACRGRLVGPGGCPREVSQRRAAASEVV
jgi:hypothetical protein